MKKISFLLFFTVYFCCFKPLNAQQNINSTVIDLVGVWQYGSPRLGDQLNQSFAFFKNGNFFFNNGKLGDDLVSTSTLKGRYRIDKNKMYFTIISRMVIDNSNIGVIDPQIDFGIFEYKDILPKEIIEKAPKELIDPVVITIIKPNQIKINNEEYYKVSGNPNDASKL